MSSKFVVYQIKNTENGKSYIGYTSKTVEARFKQHFKEANSASHHLNQNHFHKALRAHNVAVWTVSILEELTSLEEATTREQFYIKTLNTKLHGYNSTDGGEGTYGYQWTPEQRQRASEQAYERTQEHREKQRQVMLSNLDKIAAVRRTDEYRQKQRERNLGANNPNFGKKLSEDHKRKIRESLLKRRLQENDNVINKEHNNAN